MINVKGNAWSLLSQYDALCITTNGFVKNNGACVMGRGIAKEATKKFPKIEFELGSLINEHGNHCFKIKDNIATFVVKHNWWENADLELIRRSCEEITVMASENNWNKVLIPRPGCGNGNLSYADVEPVLSELLDDRFYIITF